MNRNPSHLFVASIALIVLLSFSPAQATMIATGDGAGTLHAGLTDADFDQWNGHREFMVHTNGSTSGYLSVTNYIDDSSASFGQTRVLTDTWYRDDAFNQTTRGTSWAGGPFALTTLAAVSHSGDDPQETSFANFIAIDAPVDAPGTVAMLSIGLIGFGVSRRTRPTCAAEANPA